MDFSSYICPGLLTLVPVLYFIGYALKRSHAVKDKHIPLALMAIGCALAMLWVLASTPSSIFAAAFTAIVQGVLCTAAAVFTHQIIKQGRKWE